MRTFQHDRMMEVCLTRQAPVIFVVVVVVVVVVDMMSPSDSTYMVGWEKARSTTVKRRESPTSFW